MSITNLDKLAGLLFEEFEKTAGFSTHDWAWLKNKAEEMDWGDEPNWAIEEVAMWRFMAKRVDTWFKLQLLQPECCRGFVYEWSGVEDPNTGVKEYVKVPCDHTVERLLGIGR